MICFNYFKPQRGWLPHPIIAGGTREFQRKNPGVKTRFCNIVIEDIQRKNDKRKVGVLCVLYGEKIKDWPTNRLGQLE
jgi:hypothetical protein